MAGERRLRLTAAMITYDLHRKNMAARQRAESTTGRDIGQIPPPIDVHRRNLGLDDPEFFLRTYFPNRFYLAFGTPHRRAIRTLGGSTESGRLHTIAMMRGSGNTPFTDFRRHPGMPDLFMLIDLH